MRLAVVDVRLLHITLSRCTAAVPHTAWPKVSFPLETGDMSLPTFSKSKFFNFFYCFYSFTVTLWTELPRCEYLNISASQPEQLQSWSLVPEQVLCIEVRPTISSWYHSTSLQCLRVSAMYDIAFAYLCIIFQDEKNPRFHWFHPLSSQKIQNNMHCASNLDLQERTLTILVCICLIIRDSPPKYSGGSPYTM